MRDDSPDTDLRSLWQSQPTEPSVMTPEEIRQKTQELHARTRRELLRGISVPLLVTGVSGYGMTRASNPLLQAAFALAIVWSLAGQYFVHRGMWSERLPGDVALSTGLESYRREVERRRYLAGRFLWWSFGPVLLTLGSVIALLVSLGMRNRGMLLGPTLLRMTPFLGMVVLWLVSVFVIRMRNLRELRREIEALNHLELPPV
jgi:hypothetical protein